MRFSVIGVDIGGTKIARHISNGIAGSLHDARYSAPLAKVGILAPWGIALDPAVDAVLMSASTVIVSINAQFLRGLELTTA